MKRHSTTPTHLRPSITRWGNARCIPHLSRSHLLNQPSQRSCTKQSLTTAFTLPSDNNKEHSDRHNTGPSDQPPDYTSIDNTLLNQLIFSLFRRKMADALHSDSPLQGYPAIIDLTRKLNSLGSPRQTQIETRKILNSLFPSWLPPAFKVMFSKPLKAFSCQLNAFATWFTCQWLMGPCTINDTPVDGGLIGKGHGVLVARCRYLEESRCASICINSCKIPTQEFFEKDMGLPLTMAPNYETFECQFSFGLTPPPPEFDETFATGCFAQCPTARGRVLTGGNDETNEQKTRAAWSVNQEERCFRIDA